MANNVFANGREISCKKADGKSVGAFPDVCFTPPQTPATPPGGPVPYPNTGLAKDTTGGSKTVKISGKEVMLRNKSYFKKSGSGKFLNGLRGLVLIPSPRPSPAGRGPGRGGQRKVYASHLKIHHYQKSIGDEAGRAPKKGLITSTNKATAIAGRSKDRGRDK